MSSWELSVNRLGMHVGVKTRTYSTYSVSVNGVPDPGLQGFMCESKGPGDNSRANNGRRIEPGRYPLWTQFGRYRSIGYSIDTSVAGDPPMPGLLLAGTRARTGILIHPAHPPSLFLSSVGCLNPTGALSAIEDMNFWDSRARVVQLIESLKKFAPVAFRTETATSIPGASVTVAGEPTQLVGPDMAALTAMHAATAAIPIELPISEKEARRCATWLMQHFGVKIAAAVKGRPYRAKHICAIVCQETAYKWLKWTDTLSPADILARCVFDASGDHPVSPRSAFPVNTKAFRDVYGKDLTEMLSKEANITRRLQNYDDRQWVYKGYGIFQYDLQHIKTDEAFFRERQWCDFDVCLAKCCAELDAKLKSRSGDLWQAIKAYNGSGSRATAYAQKVKRFADICAEVTGD